MPLQMHFLRLAGGYDRNDPTGDSKRTVRYYSAKTLEPFLRHIVQRYGYRSIYFDDDTFNLGNQHTMEMCEMMAGIGLPWSAMCRADTIRMETWTEMKKSGCYGVKLGFESGNQYVVDKIVNKHLDLKYAANVVHHLRKLGMTVHGPSPSVFPGRHRIKSVKPSNLQMICRSIPARSPARRKLKEPLSTRSAVPGPCRIRECQHGRQL